MTKAYIQNSISLLLIVVLLGGCSNASDTEQFTNATANMNSIDFTQKPLQTYSDSVLYALSGFSHLSGIGSIEEWMTLPFISNDFYQEIEDDIIKAIESVWEMPLDDIQLTDNTVYVPISIYDQKLLVALPVDKVDAGLMYTLRAANGFATSGKCTGCEGRCHYKSVKLGAIVYCDGCDSGCTLHTDK